MIMRVCVFNSCYFPVIFHCVTCILHTQLYKPSLQMDAPGANIIRILILYAYVSDECNGIYYNIEVTVFSVSQGATCVGSKTASLMDPIYTIDIPGQLRRVPCPLSIAPSRINVVYDVQPRLKFVNSRPKRSSKYK